MSGYKKIWGLAVTLFVLLCTYGHTVAQQKVFKINQIPVEFTEDKAAWLAHQSAIAATDPLELLLQMKTVLTQEQKSQLLANTIILQEYLGSNVYMASLKNAASIGTLDFIKAAAKVLPQYKIAKTIQLKLSSQKSAEVLVSFLEGINARQIQEIIQSCAAQPLQSPWEKRGLHLVRIDSERVQQLAAFYGTKYIGVPANNVALDLDSKGGQGAIQMSLPLALGGEGLSGQSVFIGHGDNCSGIYHIDQSDRTINYNIGDKTSHGVLVNGLIAGDGIIDPAGQGIAPNATCISLFFDAVLLLKDELYKGFNATLTNNSYAAIVGDCSYSGTYDELSQLVDKMAFELPEQLDVFAAGNDGRLTCGVFPSGYHNICGGYQTAKNILSVGATSRDLVLGDGSSRGPINDGRIKPEITAAGIDVLCPVPPNDYTITRGTSLSCPQVTGVLALLTERYKQLNAGANPKSDLLKAITMNSASDLGRPGPDYWYGFGFLNASRALETIEQKRFTRDKMASGGAARNITLAVPANTAQLKVMLYYHDPAASAASSTQLVNDLDLTVTAPGGLLHQPMVLDSSPSALDHDAKEGEDHINNVEQVIINAPSSGNYTVRVSDFMIPKGPQEYVLVYDIVPNDIKLLYPVANSNAPANTDMYVYWDAPDDAINTTKIEYSIDNGASWLIMAAAVPANTRYYKWAVPDINSGKCRIRISRGRLTDEIGPFAINKQSEMALSLEQCPGSVSVNWTAVPAADKYYLLLKKGAHLSIVDSVRSAVLQYRYTGLSTSTEYYMAVQPVVAGQLGYRSKAVSAIPNTGTCAAVPEGDLSIVSIDTPLSGRRYTSTALSAKTPLVITVRNQNPNRVSNFTCSYRLNAARWISKHSFSIAANTSQQFLIDSLDLSDTIAYTLSVAVQNDDRPDPVVSNDSLVRVLRHLPNDTIDLSPSLLLDFEDLAELSLLHDTVGLSKDGFWDYTHSNDTGRLRSTIAGSKLVPSSRSISMDINMNCSSNVNYFTGTFNLSKYDTSVDEIRFEFDYEMRGMPVLRDSNKVWIRGSDTAAWIPVFSYENTLDTAKMHHSGTLSLRDNLRFKAQNYSASTQIRFGQYDTTLIVDDHVGGGLSIDNVLLYKVTKDLQLSRIVSPQASECAISTVPLSISIKNGTIGTIKEVSLGYQLDGNTPILENLADSIAGADSLIYTFKTLLSRLALGRHELKVWLNTPGDDYLNNDTIGAYQFYNGALIDSFPYLEQFETGNGNWHTNGRFSSWAYGKPEGVTINKAASGTKVWATNLKGNYNNNEQSYLISPCLNTIGLSNPMLSFSMTFELERCEVVCDRVFMEYSVDNEQSWSRLGSTGLGTNWYNNEVHNVWNGKETRWHVASIPLPRASTLKLRFVMMSDLGTNFEGFALDDIHIFDLKYPLAQLATEEALSATSFNSSEDNYTDFINKELLLASVQLEEGADKNAIDVLVYPQKNLTDPVKRQYVMPRSFVINTDSGKEQGSRIKLYLSDQELQAIWSDTSCPTCSRAADIYRTGVSQWQNQDVSLNDQFLSNNIRATSQFYPYTQINWVPYDKGYYADFVAKPQGEFWFNNGGITQSLAANTEYVQLTAAKINDLEASITWESLIDTQLQQYELQVDYDSLNFDKITTLASIHNTNISYQYVDKPSVQEGEKVYYRVLCTTLSGEQFYSNTAAVLWSKGEQLISVYPNPSADGLLYLQWTGAIGSEAELLIKDVLGKTIYSQTIQANAWLNTTELSLNHLSKGLYFLSFSIGNHQYLEKLIFK